MSLSDTITPNTSVKGCNVQVAVRCRPLNGEEKKSGQPTVVTCDSENKTIKVAYGPAGKKIMKNFTFDKVFGSYSRQEEVFEQIVRPIVDETLAGFNCTIFAYGQTGTGKTHTMEGDIHSTEDAGIVPRAVNAILEQLEASGSEFTIRVSFLELYNEELQDLLNVSGDKKLKLCEDVKKGVVCQNLEEIAVLNANDIFDILQRGIQQRQTAATLCNKNSSRSHSIFTMKIMIKEYNIEGEEVVRHGQLNLVDLAGSECIGRSGAKNDRAREAGSINQSLLTLGRVITALVDHHPHVPYRDSKLTRLLQESLGGKAKTCIIATLSPSNSAVEETMSTLDYAYRAKNIKNQPTVNQKLTKKVIMKEYFAEIETLRNQLMMTREKNGVYVDPQEFYAMESKIASQEALLMECEAALKQRNEEFKLVKSENDDLTNRLQDTMDELTEKHEELLKVQDQYEIVKDELSTAFVELKATEAVVGEQAVTEKELSRLGHTLERNITEKSHEIEILLKKIQSMEASDQQKMLCSTSFTSKLMKSTNQLLSSLQILSTQNVSSSNILNNGIATMLTKGKDTCSSLQSALDKAIGILLHDTTIAKDEMITSCTQLTSHVQENKASICSQLQQVQKELATWLSSTQSTMQVMQEQLSKQHTQMSLIQTTLQDHQSMVQKESETFLGQQHALSKQFQADILLFKEKLLSYQATFFSEMDESMLAQQKTLQSKAKNIESTITTLLQDLLAVNSEIYSSQKSKMVQYQQEQQTVVTNGTTSLLGLHTKSQQQEDAYQQMMVQKMSEHNKKMVSSMQEVQSGISVPIKTIQDTLVPSVGLKRKGYEENMQNIQGNIASLTNHTIERIGKTSSMAESVLTKVHTASTAMNQSMHSDLDQFVVYMQQEGEQVYSVVKSHFSDLEKANATHEKDVVTMQQNTTTYVTEYPTYEVKPTGHTPKKCKVLPPVSYASTRGHEYIKYDCRNALQEITYDVIHESVSAISKAHEQPLPTPPPAVVEIEEETVNAPSLSLEATLEANFTQKAEKSNNASQEDSTGNTTEGEDSENVAPAMNTIALSATTPSTTKGRGKGSRSANSKIASVGTRSTRSSVVTSNLEI